MTESGTLELRHIFLKFLTTHRPSPFHSQIGTLVLMEKRVLLVILDGLIWLLQT